MSIWGISDLHLSFKHFDLQDFASWQTYKPMDIFGDHWQGHEQILYENWQKAIQPEDFILVPGDLSWGMNIHECQLDFEFISQLNGTLLICKGNHDYWWDSKSKVQKALPQNVIPMQNESVIIENICLSATRGWTCPESKDFTQADQKIFNRELIRLEMALQSGKQLLSAQENPNTIERWVMFHYRPTNDQFVYNPMIELMLDYGVTRCFYGHLHGSNGGMLLGEHWGIDFNLLSCDYLQFAPLLLK